MFKREAHVGHEREGGDDGGGNRDGGHERPAQAAEEEHDHDHGQQSAPHQLALRLVDAGRHEAGEVLGNGQLVAVGQVVGRVSASRSLTAVGHGQHVAARLPPHQQRDGALAVEPGQAAEVFQAVLDPRHVPQVDGDPLAVGHDQVGKLLDLLDLALGLDDDLPRIGLDPPARRLDVFLPQCVQHVAGGQLMRQHRVSAQPDPDFPLALAHQLHTSHSRNPFQTPLHDVVRIVAQLTDRGGAGEHDGQDRRRIGIEFLDDRRFNVAWQLSPYAGNLVPYVLADDVDVLLQLEFDEDLRESLGALAAQRLDAGDRVDRLFNDVRNFRFHGFRVGTFVGHRDGHDREVHVREQVDAHRAVRRVAEHDQRQSHHGREDGTGDGYFGDLHRVNLGPASPRRPGVQVGSPELRHGHVA